MTVPPECGVATDWEGFLIGLRSAGSVRWARRLARMGQGDAGELMDKLLGAASGAGWNEGLTGAPWLAFVSSLQQVVLKRLPGHVTAISVGHSPFSAARTHI